MDCYNYLPIGVRVDFDPVTIKLEVLSIFCRTRILRLKLCNNKSIFSLSLSLYFLSIYSMLKINKLQQ